jgi:hypothetical protein
MGCAGELLAGRDGVGSPPPGHDHPTSSGAKSWTADSSEDRDRWRDPQASAPQGGALLALLAVGGCLDVVELRILTTLPKEVLMTTDLD